MNEIKSLKTRDKTILNDSLCKMAGLKDRWIIDDHIEVLGLLSKMNHDTYIVHSTKLNAFVFTDIFCDDLVYQEYFGGLNFVVIDSDMRLAIARGIHYYFNKKIGL
jgi:hypothetical protein